MDVSRDYFDGCHNVPMFDADTPCYCPSDCNCRHADIGRVNYCGCRQHPQTPAADAPTAVDIVRAAIGRKRDCRNGGQLALPAELLPVADGRLFT